MALLTSGEYDLIEKSGVRDKKSMLFVKLTDSAQRALNDFFKNQDKCKTPIIEFNKDDGRIYIPTSSKGSVESDKCMAQFKFNVISNVAMQGQQGRFECIQHKRGSKHLIKFGQLTHRLRIHANEDVFETTKNRMAAIELEQRKNCTREIDWNATSGINRKVRIDRSLKPSPVTPSVENPPVRSVTSVPALNKSSKVNVASTPIENFERFSNSPMTRVTKARNPKPRQNNAATLKTTSNPAIMKRPLKERIIHLLAIRPHKKLELFAALRRDGLRESDKSHLMHTLVSISTLRDNTYQLLRHVWNDIQEDWPFYTEQERQQMKRNKPQNLTPPSSDSGISVGSNQSPNSNSFSGDKSPSCQYKRPGYFHGVDGLQTKRHRISHYSRPGSKPLGNEENVQISPSQITNCFDEVIEKSGLFSTAVKHPPLRPNYRCNKSMEMDVDTKPTIQQKELNKSVPESSAYAKSIRNASDNLDTKDLNIIPHSDVYNSENTANKIKKEPYSSEMESPESPPYSSNKSSKEFSNTCSNSSTSMSMQSNPSSSIFPLPLKMSQMKLPDDSVSESTYFMNYEKKYTPITNIEQRRQYKDDFNSIFGEYNLLNDRINEVSGTFSQLGAKLKKCEKGSSEFRRIEHEIKMRYVKSKEENFEGAKQRYEYLYGMLSHIKGLVSDYDEKILNF